MKKFWIKTIVFILILGSVFLFTQKYLKYHWHEDTYERYLEIAQEPYDSIDVLALGTSEMYHGYAPVAGFYAAGITGYNLSIQNRSAMTAYYQLKYALKHIHPKLVICDFVCLFDNELPSESESVYRRTVDNMPDFQIKRELIKEICKVDDSQNPIDWYFPMLRYHSIWSELSEGDFVNDKEEFSEYPDYAKGVNLEYNHCENPYDIVPELWDADMEANELSEFSMNYYDKLIDLCNENDIKIVCVLTPKVSDAAVYSVNVPVMEEYLTSRGVKCMNYCTYDKICSMGLSLYNDYSDPAHLNALGALKFTTMLSQDLADKFNLEDRREAADSETTQKWNGLWEPFVSYYENMQ